MAQDFYAAFGVGEDDRHITSIDEDGVALAAIKALHAENADLHAENAGLRQRVARDEAQRALDHARLAKLDQAVQFLLAGRSPKH
jgi:cell division protein FtsB